MFNNITKAHIRAKKRWCYGCSTFAETRTWTMVVGKARVPSWSLGQERHSFYATTLTEQRGENVQEPLGSALKSWVWSCTSYIKVPIVSWLKAGSKCRFTIKRNVGSFHGGASMKPNLTRENQRNVRSNPNSRDKCTLKILMDQSEMQFIVVFPHWGAVFHSFSYSGYIQVWTASHLKPNISNYTWFRGPQ